MYCTYVLDQRKVLLISEHAGQKGVPHLALWDQRKPALEASEGDGLLAPPHGAEEAAAAGRGRDRGRDRGRQLRGVQHEVAEVVQTAAQKQRAALPAERGDHPADVLSGTDDNEIEIEIEIVEE
jgi:hypothetical protein